MAPDLKYFDDLAAKVNQKYSNVPKELIYELWRQESGFNPNAKSGAGAQGLGQFMPGTAKQYGITDPFNAEENGMASGHYLSDLMTRFGGDHIKALAAYNAGPGAVEKYNGVPPFPETQNYTKSIDKAYAASLGSQPRIGAQVNKNPQQKPSGVMGFLGSLFGSKEPADNQQPGMPADGREQDQAGKRGQDVGGFQTQYSTVPIPEINMTQAQNEQDPTEGRWESFLPSGNRYRSRINSLKGSLFQG